MRLATRYKDMTTQERDELAASVGVASGYLYQLATRWRGKRPSVGLLAKLAAVDPSLTLPDLVAEFSEDQDEAAA